VDGGGVRLKDFFDILIMGRNGETHFNLFKLFK